MRFQEAHQEAKPNEDHNMYILEGGVVIFQTFSGQRVLVIGTLGV